MNGNKRRRVEVNKNQFRPGYIEKVKVSNFTTYSEGEFNLSPSLNMIIGPNGTGKSTLVAAICLGLGGKIDLIKRKNMKSMIKTGQTRSIIEIWIKNYDNEPSIIIKREFTDKESRWSINNRPANESKIKEIRKKFNIQLDNLCHFLPQERVAEFAGLSPEKLLLETERTLGDGHLLESHQDLIRMDNESQTISSNIEDIEIRLNQLLEEKSKLEEEAKRFEEYEKKLKQIDLHNKLIPYAQLLDLKKQKEQLQRDTRAAKDALNKFSASIEPAINQVQQFWEHVEQCVKVSKQFQDEEIEVKSRIDNAKSDLNKIKDNIDSLKGSIITWRKRSSESKIQLDKLRKDKLLLEEALNDIEDIDDNLFQEIRKTLQNKNEDKNNIVSTIEQLESESKPIARNIDQLERKKVEIQNRLKGSDKLALLEHSETKNTQRDVAYNSHVRLRMTSELKNHYFECPIVSCTVTDVDFAKVLEKVVDNNSLFSITTTNNEDFNLIRKFAEEIKINFPIRLTDVKNIPQPAINVEQIKAFGFDGYLSDFVEGPKEVLSMLYDTSKIYNIPVSKQPFTTSQIDKLIKNGSGYIPFMKFIAGNIMYNINRSRYGSKQIFYTTEQIDDARYFNSKGLSEETRIRYNNQLQEVNNQIKQERIKLSNFQNSITTAKEERRAIQHEMEKLVNKSDSIKALKKKKTALETKLSNKKEDIAKTIRISKRDYSEKIDKALQEVNAKYLESSQQMIKISNYIQELTNLTIETNMKKFAVIEAKNKHTKAQSMLQDLESEKERLQEEYHILKEEYSKIKKGDAAKKIEEQSRSYTQEERADLAELAQMYKDNEELTERIIREKISILEDEKSVMATADQSSIETLRRKLKEIETAGRELPRLKTAKERLDERIKTIQDSWESELQALVNQISLSFNKRFTKVASDGQVELAKSERFKDWKLQILVKFREESDLKILDHQSQSGGERAVSTIFFIMSLQGLTDAPFRVVDEINQGMDPKNEKMAHRYFVHTACQNQNSQYFLVTPKLLTGLYYHPDMVVHCIYTGPLIEAPEESTLSTGFMDFTKIY
ncbi:uncharacterized protein RJT21DRAFT_131015 [Scheffersomyces amazonensis]|uniref:uncharacterized protein n=1 Tax=Scheffersomyces amazonensis TaxID=1078765 RepID=UPI00315DA7F5